jgi:coupling of ubiquitin conjugation to ER degradation protein 1
MADEQTINFPQLLLALLLGGLAIRWFFFSAPVPRNAYASSSASNIRAREADVERIQQMFPQVPRRSIMWDLQRNGGNMAATTERILSGRGLETVSSIKHLYQSFDPWTDSHSFKPPQTFQPPLPAATPSSSVNTKPAASKPLQPDLITRYNLSSKIASSNLEAESGGIALPASGKQAWSQNKGERQALLQRRREEMILAARKKMEAKVAAESAMVQDESIPRQAWIIEWHDLLLNNEDTPGAYVHMIMVTEMPLWRRIILSWLRSYGVMSSGAGILSLHRI